MEDNYKNLATHRRYVGEYFDELKGMGGEGLEKPLDAYGRLHDIRTYIQIAHEGFVVDWDTLCKTVVLNYPKTFAEYVDEDMGTDPFAR